MEPFPNNTVYRFFWPNLDDPPITEENFVEVVGTRNDDVTLVGRAGEIEVPVLVAQHHAVVLTIKPGGELVEHIEVAKHFLWELKKLLHLKNRGRVRSFLQAGRQH